MNISFENPDKVNGLLTITVEESDFQDSVEKTLKDYRKKANIPGFRPGQAPMGLIKRQFGASVRYDAVNKFVGEQLYKYIKDNNIQMLGELCLLTSRRLRLTSKNRLLTHSYSTSLLLRSSQSTSTVATRSTTTQSRLTRSSSTSR